MMSLSKLVPYSSGGDFNTFEELGGWLKVVKSGKTRSFCYISDELFEKILEKGMENPRKGTFCSSDEILEMNNSLGVDAFSADRTVLWTRVTCTW